MQIAKNYVEMKLLIAHKNTCLYGVYRNVARDFHGNQRIWAAVEKCIQFWFTYL